MAPRHPREKGAGGRAVSGSHVGSVTSRPKVTKGRRGSRGLRSTGVPAYQGLANQLRDAILANKYPPGRRLPTEGELEVEHKLSRQTVRRAFQELNAGGLIYRVRKRGTFAVPTSAPFLRSFGSVEDMINLPADIELEVLEPLQRGKDPQRDATLGGAGEFWTLQLRQWEFGHPILMSEIALAKEIGRLLRDEPALTTVGHRGRFSIIGLVDRLWPDGIGGVLQTVRAAEAGKDLAACLDCRPGEPLLKAERLYSDRKGRPIELATTFFHPRHYVFQTRMQR